MIPLSFEFTEGVHFPSTNEHTTLNLSWFFRGNGNLHKYSKELLEVYRTYEFQDRQCLRNVTILEQLFIYRKLPIST